MINLKNKKAQEATTNEIKGFVIGGLVLALVITGFVLIAVYGPGAFYKYLPDFGNKTTVVVDSEKFRYSILDDKVQYYDGDKWRGFDKEVTLNDKRISYDGIKQSFVGYYFFSNREYDTYELNDGYSAYFHLWQHSGKTERGQVVGASFWEKLWGMGMVKLNSGDILIDFVEKGQIKGYVYLSSKSNQLIEVSGRAAATLTKDVEYNLDVAELLKKYPAWSDKLKQGERQYLKCRCLYNILMLMMMRKKVEMSVLVTR